MRLTPAQLVCDARCTVGESLVWHANEQALYWVDIPAKQLHRYHPSTGGHTQWTAPEMMGCIAVSDQAGFLAGMETGVYHLEVEGANLNAQLLAVAPHTAPQMRFNDGRGDRQGRFIASTMTKTQAVGVGNPSIYQYSHSKLRTILSDFVRPFTTPNGIAFSPDGKTFYLSDTHASQQRVWAFDYDITDGTVTHCRQWIDMQLYPGRPDGATVDTDGCYWVCATDAGMVHRFTPQGELDLSLTVPVKKPTICTFGGADLRTLYVASIRPQNTDLSDQPLAGAVFAFQDLPFQGIAETPCKLR